VHMRSGYSCENESKGYRCSRPVTDYPHHITERGMSGGRGLDIPINLLDVCPECHDHDDSNFLYWCDWELDRRINQLFKPGAVQTLAITASLLEMDYNEILRQARKGFLKADFTGAEWCASTEDIRRWLHGH
jgi:hypothetical protein